jgi:quinol-cytochrome oxidoreductase complex cytochrome b subunit
MGVKERISANWRRAAETRHRGKWYFIAYFLCIACLTLGVFFESKLFVLGLLGMPYCLFGVMYSNTRSPKSRVVWVLLLFFSICFYALFALMTWCGDNQNLEISDALLVAALLVLASGQLRLLMRVRPIVFGTMRTESDDDT